MPDVVPAQRKAATIRDLFANEQVRKSITDALPRHLDATRMLRIYQTAVQVTRGIADCDALSVVGAVVQAAQLGLSIDTIMGEAYLIPRNNKNCTHKVCQFQIGYKGYIKLARNADTELRDIFAYAVRENDDFDYELGMEPRIIRHKPQLKGDRGPLLCAYAVGVWDVGYKRIVIADQDAIERAMSSSDAYVQAEKYGKKTSPWHTDPDAMWRKTALRRWFATVPLSASATMASTLAHETIDGRTFWENNRNLDAALLASRSVPELSSGDVPRPQPTAAPATKGSPTRVAEGAEPGADAQGAPPAAPASSSAQPAAPADANLANRAPKRRPGRPPNQRPAQPPAPTPAPAARPATPAQPAAPTESAAAAAEFHRVVEEHNRQREQDADGDDPPPDDVDPEYTDDGDLPDNVERMHPEHPTQTRLFDDQPELYRNRRPPGMSDPDDEEDEGA